MNFRRVEDSMATCWLPLRWVDTRPGLRVVGEAADPSQALALTHWTRPGIVVRDLSLATGSGLVPGATYRTTCRTACARPVPMRVSGAAASRPAPLDIERSRPAAAAAPLASR